MYFVVTLAYSGLVIFAPDYIVYLFPLILVLLILNRNNSLFFTYYIILALTCNNVYAIIALMGLNTFFIYHENLMYNTTSKTFIALILLIVLTGLITVYNFNNLYDILWFGTIISMYGLITLKVRVGDTRISEKSIYTIFLILVITQILYRYMVIYERGSIFNISENIAAIIFLLMLLKVLFSKSISRLKKYTVLLLYIWIVLSTDSRMTPILLVIVGIALCYSMFINYKKTILIGTALLVTTVFFKYQTEFTEYSTRQTFLLNYYNIHKYEQTRVGYDPRYLMTNDAINRISQKPCFGNGVTTPELLALDGIKGSSFHNAYLDLTVTYGIIGSFIILLTIGYMLLVRYNMSNHFILFSIGSFFLLSSVHPIFINIKTGVIFVMLLNSSTVAISDSKYKIRKIFA